MLNSGTWQICPKTTAIPCSLVLALSLEEDVGLPVFLLDGNLFGFCVAVKLRSDRRLICVYRLRGDDVARAGSYCSTEKGKITT